MELFLQTALSFPTAIYSFLLCVAVIYWLVVAAGLLEVDLLDVEADSMMEGSGQTEGLAGLLYKLKLDGVPVTLVLTLLFFFAWFACYFIELWLLRHLPLGILRYPLGLVIIAGALVLAAPLRGNLPAATAAVSQSRGGQQQIGIGPGGRGAQRPCYCHSW